MQSLILQFSLLQLQAVNMLGEVEQMSFLEYFSDETQLFAIDKKILIMTDDPNGNTTVCKQGKLTSQVVSQVKVLEEIERLVIRLK